MPAPTRSFTARHVQLARAALAAIAAIMITFSPDHSAAVGLSVFGGFTGATALVLVLAAILVHPKGQRWPSILLAAVTFLIGAVGSFPALRTDLTFFIAVAAWAGITGLIELILGIRARGTEGARDAMTVGGLGVLLAVLLALVPIDYSLEYAVEGNPFTLTGIVIGVGLFGGYAAIVAVFLGIAGLAPNAKKTDASTAEHPTSENDIKTDAGADRLADHGGIA